MAATTTTENILETSILETSMYLRCKKEVEEADTKIAKYMKMYADLDDKLSRELEHRHAEQSKAWGRRHMAPMVPKAEQLAKFWATYRPLVEALKADVLTQRRFVEATNELHAIQEDIRLTKLKADEDWKEACARIRASWDIMYVTGRPGYYA